MKNRLFIVIFLFNPFLALLYEIRRLNSKVLANAIMLFCAFYGTTQYMGKENERYKDISVYRDNFYEMYDKNVSWTNFNSSLFDGQTTFDIAIPAISFVTAAFTRNVKVLLFILGLIFGFFYGRNIVDLIDLLDKSDSNRFIYFIIFVFALIVPFWAGLNGLRMWIGAHIYFFGVVKLLRGYGFWNFLYLFLSVLFHFSYISIVLLFVVFFFTRVSKSITIYFILFIISFLIAEMNVGKLADIVKIYSPEIFKAKSEEYTKEVYVESFKFATDDYSWHARIYSKMLLYSMFYLVLISFLKLRHITMSQRQSDFFSFALILFSFANVISQLPSGGRFYSLAFLFSLLSICDVYSLFKRKWMLYICIPSLLFWVTVHIRDGFDHFTLATFLSNPILTWLDVLSDNPLIDLIK